MNIENSNENTYIKKVCYEPDSPLNYLRSIAIKDNIPIIGDEVFRFLKVFLSVHKPSDILEVGSAVGYSGSLMLMNSSAKLTTIEKNEDHYERAIKTFEENSLRDRVDPRCGDAEDVLKNLVLEKKTFDMFFIDGPKGKYYEHFKLAEPMLKKGGVVMFDNVLYQGLVAGRRSIRRNNTIRQRMRVLVDELMKSELYISSLVNVEGGLLICKKR